MPPKLRAIWLVLLGFLPQWIAFFLPATRTRLSDGWVSVALISSQVLLLIFVWLNRKSPGFWALGLGLVLNLLVIVANGGLMPLSPENATRLVPGTAPGEWVVGSRWGYSKDVVLPADQTWLPWLSDRFLFPGWIPYQVAFSAGDVLIAIGAFLLLWAAGARVDSSKLLSGPDGLVGEVKSIE